MAKDDDKKQNGSGNQNETDGPKSTPPPLNNRAMSKKLVKVRVGDQPINEDGFRDAKSEFELPQERAKALGSLVTIID
jgi:hypothetical protein